MIRAFCLALSLSLPAVASSADEGPGREVVPATLDHPLLAPFLTAQAFDCRNLTCGQISSCAEACYKLIQCGHTARDGDGDGIPCESLCSRRCE
ncbi:excalibur calcium-binding domain-containing protein [Wenxinia saemankumensis]|uniref:excalibur calcium-binding domain-containing protein n=1 Tax=Wenxinia saemankumensis TaxID=1447782 RepID=UPI0009FAFBE2|nr:excalibur calcium-binding domain-containing protein [Wenxinia saemankumensis]